MKQFFNSVKEVLSDVFMTYEDRVKQFETDYLAGATDLCDLEYRQKVLKTYFAGCRIW